MGQMYAFFNISGTVADFRDSVKSCSRVSSLYLLIERVFGYVIACAIGTSIGLALETSEDSTQARKGEWD